MTVLDVSVGADTDSHAMYSNHSINNLFAGVKSTLGKSNRTEKARILRRQIKTMKDR